MNCANCTWLNPIAAPFALMLMALYKLFQGAPENPSTYAYALALFFIAIIVRALLLPFQMKGKRGMLRQTRLQPKINEIQKRHGANKQKQQEEMAKLYKEEGVNPAAGCLWNFIQMPIMIALFYAIRQPLSLMMRLGEDVWKTTNEVFNESGQIYRRFVELIDKGIFTVPDHLLPDADTIARFADRGIELNPNFFNPTNFYVELHMMNAIDANWGHFRDLMAMGLQRISFYLGNVNLAEVPQWNFFWNTDWSDPSIWGPAFILFLLPLISGAAQFVSAHINRKTMPQPTPEANQGSAGTIMKLMPLMSVWFGFILPGALSIYWTIGTGLQIAQDVWLTKRYTRILDEEDAEKEKLRREKEAEIEAKRLETERLKAEGLLAENPNTSKRKKQKTERQIQREKAAEWEKKNAPSDDDEKSDEPGRVGNRRYARGRAYDPDRFVNPDGEDENSPDDYINDADENESDDDE